MSNHSAKSGFLTQSAVQNICHYTQSIYQIIVLKNHSCFGSNISKLSFVNVHDVFSIVDDFTICSIHQAIDAA